MSARKLRILGVDVLDATMDEALAAVGQALETGGSAPCTVFFVNAHTLNLAAEDPAYRADLNGADFVFGDGTGVRWGARLLYGARLRDNVNGTDFVPHFFAARAGRGHRYFLLGGTAEAIDRAAEAARDLFPGWEQAGHHHGYLADPAENQRAVDLINASAADVLLVGMGNPLQERWIARHRSTLAVKLCLGVGGLYSYWTGDLERAPAWVRRLGQEWVHIMLRQPQKLRRYMLGNPLFLGRVVGARVLGDRILRSPRRP